MWEILMINLGRSWFGTFNFYFSFQHQQPRQKWLQQIEGELEHNLFTQHLDHQIDCHCVRYNVKSLDFCFISYQLRVVQCTQTKHLCLRWISRKISFEFHLKFVWVPFSHEYHVKINVIHVRHNCLCIG